MITDRPEHVSQSHGNWRMHWFASLKESLAFPLNANLSPSKSLFAFSEILRPREMFEKAGYARFHSALQNIAVTLRAVSYTHLTLPTILLV